METPKHLIKGNKWWSWHQKTRKPKIVKGFYETLPRAEIEDIKNKNEQYLGDNEIWQKVLNMVLST